MKRSDPRLVLSVDEAWLVGEDPGDHPEELPGDGEVKDGVTSRGGGQEVSSCRLESVHDLGVVGGESTGEDGPAQTVPQPDVCRPLQQQFDTVELTTAGSVEQSRGPVRVPNVHQSRLVVQESLDTVHTAPGRPAVEAGEALPVPGREVRPGEEEEERGQGGGGGGPHGRGPPEPVPEVQVRPRLQEAGHQVGTVSLDCVVESGGPALVLEVGEGPVVTEEPDTVHVVTHRGPVEGGVASVVGLVHLRRLAGQEELQGHRVT